MDTHLTSKMVLNKPDFVWNISIYLYCSHIINVISYFFSSNSHLTLSKRACIIKKRSPTLLKSGFFFVLFIIFLVQAQKAIQLFIPESCLIRVQQFSNYFNSSKIILNSAQLVEKFSWCFHGYQTTTTRKMSRTKILFKK